MPRAFKFLGPALVMVPIGLSNSLNGNRSYNNTLVLYLLSFSCWTDSQMVLIIRNFQNFRSIRKETGHFHFFDFLKLIQLWSNRRCYSNPIIDLVPIWCPILYILIINLKRERDNRKNGEGSLLFQANYYWVWCKISKNFTNFVRLMKEDFIVEF